MFFIKWGYVDCFGDFNETWDNVFFVWFDTEKEAKAFAKREKKVNGNYVKIVKVAEGNYERFLKMENLKAQLEELRKEF